MSSLGSDPPPGDRVARGFAIPERIRGEVDRWRNTASGTRERPEHDRSRRLFRTELERDAALDACRAKDDFVADLAHELLSPLQAMVGWLTVLRTGTLGPEMQARALDVLERSLEAQAVLVHELLDVSRIATGKLTLAASDVDLEAIVRNAVEDHRPGAGAKRVVLEGPPTVEPLIVHGDANRLAQVVANLLTNAVKFTPEGGVVRVALVGEAGQVVLEVRDTGRGIAPELLPHVFDRLRQGDAPSGCRQGGLGLGLAIAKHLVEQHGGSLTAQSEGIGCGSLFRVTLPRGGALR
jgi:signal transduction histidine kinase